MILETTEVDGLSCFRRKFFFYNDTLVSPSLCNSTSFPLTLNLNTSIMNRFLLIILYVNLQHYLLPHHLGGTLHQMFVHYGFTICFHLVRKKEKHAHEMSHHVNENSCVSRLKTFQPFCPYDSQ